MELRDSFWKWLYFFGMSMIVLSLPFLNLGMSIGGIFLASTWLLHSIYLGVKHSDPLFNLKKVTSSSVALTIVGFFLLHLVGMIHTEDVAYGLKDIRIKLPLLFMPLVFTGVPKFSRNSRNIIEYMFIVACAAAALVTIINYSLNYTTTGNVRQAHLFTSHIRFGLMSALAIYLVYRHLLFDQKKMKWILVIPLLILLFYLIRLQSITGIISLLVVFIVTGWIEVKRMKSKKWRLTLSAILLLTMLAPLGYLFQQAKNYFNIEVPSEVELQSLTAEGNPYDHKLGDTQVENGTLIWHFISWGELADAWRQRSDIPFEGNDKANQSVASTLIRYISSKGFKKDREGVNSLSDDDIRWIERGVPNYLFVHENGGKRRLQVLFFEINGYLNGANPSGNSLTQRFEFWRAGKHILKSRWLIGVGTGDPQRAFKQAYLELESPLEEQFRHRAHNQYMSMWISLGIIGFIWLLTVLFLPIILSPKAKSLKFIAFLVIISLSFLTEDTLETQVGITFFSFFYCYFLLLPNAAKEESVLQES